MSNDAGLHKGSFIPSSVFFENPFPKSDAIHIYAIFSDFTISTLEMPIRE